MRTTITILLLAVSLVSAWAQQMRECFAEMPDSVLPLLTKNNRLDCIDFIENGMKAQVRNRFDGFSVLQTLTDRYLSLQLTPSCTVQMRLFHTGNTPSLLCMVTTVSAPARQSIIRFYKPSWQPVETGQYIRMPASDDFWNRPDTLSAEDFGALKHKQDLRLVRAQLSEADATLTFSMEAGTVHPDDSVAVASLLREVCYRWNGKRFVVQP